ncbi:hypothetical protein O6H91_07G039700 [Diphasiastrum complanatum]|uniref:Uncharacterized protein n=1 Tax=Diphasiastrum complanatum TaxID=34168 RepID=A0ACC2D521_DIPCM|nr:hypothetical protein O6H91_07G039700 [Diphasiastrum complanatum]
MEKISVAIRVRPLSKQEVGKGSAWKIASNTINLCNSTGATVPGQSFTFDRVFDTDSKTQEIYEARTKDIISSTVGGFNGTVFAYGQTSSGKTFTMRGSPTEPGIIPLAVQDVFHNIQEAENREFLLRVSYMEIYNEEINDLLAPENRKLQVHENLERGIFVAGLREEIVVSPEQVMQLMEYGEAHRHVGETNMNTYSSRSHTIFRMVIESRDKSQDGPAGTTIQVCDAVRVSVLNLVDLAGSERVAKTGAEGARLKEGSHINKSLMTLGTVINKLSEGIENLGGHVPYRDSKLTRILQPALGGNAKTAIICNVTPAWVHVDETKGTLQFASRAIRVTNCAQVNEVMTDAALLKRQKREIEELRNKLQESHSDHLEDEILDLRNTLLKTELERERMALELEEEKKDKAERERRWKEQIENLSTMVINSAVDDRVYERRTRKNNRRETWCPRIPASDPKLSELKRSSFKKPFDSSVSRKRDRLLPLPPPFEKLSEEDECTWGNSIRKAGETLGNINPETNDEGLANDSEFTFVDPGARMYVAERRRRSSTERMGANEEELLDLQAHYQDLQCEHEAARFEMKYMMSENAKLKKQLEHFEAAAKKGSRADGKFLHTQDGDRRCKSLDGCETEVSGQILKKLQEQVHDFEIEKFYMQREIDNLMEQAQNQKMAAKEELEVLYAKLRDARQEAVDVKQQLSKALDHNRNLELERENELLLQLDLAASFDDFQIEVETTKASIAAIVGTLEADIRDVKDCAMENENERRLIFTLLHATRTKEAQADKALNRMHVAQVASTREEEGEIRSVKRKAEYDAVINLNDLRGHLWEKDSSDTQLNLHAEHVHTLEAELAQVQNERNGLIEMLEKAKEDRNAFNDLIQNLDIKLMSITENCEAKLADIESEFARFSQAALGELSQLQNEQETILNLRASNEVEIESFKTELHTLYNKIELLEENLLVTTNEKDGMLKLQMDILKEREQYDAFRGSIEMLEKENTLLAETNRTFLEELESIKVQTQIQKEQLEVTQTMLQKVTEESMVLSEVNSSLSLHNQQQQKFLEDHQRKLDQANSDLEADIELKANLFAEVENMKNLITEKEEGCRKLMDKLATLEKEKASKVAELEAHLTSLQATMQRTQNEAEQYQGEILHLRNEVIALRKEVSQAKAAPSALGKERDTIRRELDKTKSKIKDVEAKLKSTLQEKSKLEAEKVNMDRELKLLRGQSMFLQRDVSKRESLADKRRESAASGLNKTKHQLSSAEHYLQLKNVELEKAYFDMQLLQESYARVEASVSEAKDFSQLLEEKLAIAEESIVSMKDEKTSAEAKVERLAIELEAASEQWRLASSELEALREEKIKLAEELQIHITACHEAKSAAADLTKVKDELTSELTDSYFRFEEEKAAWAATKMAVENALAKESEARCDALKEIDALTKELEQLKLVQEEVLSTKKALEEQISEFQSAIEVREKECTLMYEEQIQQVRLELQSTKECICKLQEQIVAAENVGQTEREARISELSHAQAVQTLLGEKEAELAEAKKYEELFAQICVEHKDVVLGRNLLEEKINVLEKALEDAKSEASMSWMQAQQLSKTVELNKEQCKELERQIVVLEANEKEFRERLNGCNYEQAPNEGPLVMKEEIEVLKLDNLNNGDRTIQQDDKRMDTSILGTNIARKVAEDLAKVEDHVVKGLSDEILYLKATLDKVCRLQETTETVKKNLEGQVSELEEALVKEKKQVDQLEAMLIRADEEISTLSDILSNEKSIMNELRARLSAIQIEQQHWIMTEERMEIENQQKQNQNDTLLKENKKLLVSNIKLQVAFDSMEARAEVFEGRLEDARWELIEIKEKASRAPAKHTTHSDRQALESKLAAARLEIVELKVELQNSRNECRKYYEHLQKIQGHAERDVLDEDVHQQNHKIDEEAILAKADELCETEGDGLSSLQKVSISSPAESLAKRKPFDLNSVSSLRKKIKEMEQMQDRRRNASHIRGESTPLLLTPCLRFGKSMHEPDHSDFGSTRRAALLPVELNNRASCSSSVEDITKQTLLHSGFSASKSSLQTAPQDGHLPLSWSASQHTFSGLGFAARYGKFRNLDEKLADKENT